MCFRKRNSLIFTIFYKNYRIAIKNHRRKMNCSKNYPVSCVGKKQKKRKMRGFLIDTNYIKNENKRTTRTIFDL